MNFLSRLLLILGPWSDRTFGTPAEKGPQATLEHLKLEADEAAANPGDVVEFADILLLLLDANRRAGHSLEALLIAAEEKLYINVNKRTWGPRSPGVVHHVKERG